MQNSLSKGDKIITIGGLHGVVEAIEDGTVVLKSGNTKLTFDRNAIRTVLEKGNRVEASTEEKAPETEQKDEEQK